ncbi:C4-dicarboxylate ABC transporter [Clostridium fermenticellae]|uniref:C4-dicarboxylate ABC transporter n=1 Tax=Clostridium fermenticellae TaxID=2068654 RepID=A0A386H186_9CLOT|nr:TDT family transporter [Clostridium fermenticellae]AYD39325.1 C4-dicarboxylate ABC transporter [Clostridium fermenticellae]
MNQILKKCPVPIAGLILGLAAAGNLIQSYGQIYHNLFGLISAVLFIIMLVKIIKYPKGVAKSLDNPVVASVFPAFSMAIMLLAAYLKPYMASAAFIMWIIGLVLHIALIIWFTKKFAFNFKIKQVFPSWFIVYVGIVAASVSGTAFKMTGIGQIAFWFGFAAYLILLPIVVYRVVKVKQIPEQALPTFCIFAAPAGLLLAGYMNSFAVKSTALIYFLTVLSLVMYIVVIIKLFGLLKLKFYPSYSAFTFPLVISAIGVKLVNRFLVKSGQNILALKYLVKFQEVIGIVITLYVLVRYIQFLLSKDNAAINVEKDKSAAR